MYKKHTMINTISFKNYKIFKEKHTLELKPITVLIGKNNSGKSAIAKLPTLIAGSLSGDFTAPVNWQNKVGDDTIELGSSFEDLVYNRNAITSLELELFSDEEQLEVVISKNGILQYVYNGLELDINKIKTKGFLQNGTKFKTLKLNIDYVTAFRAIPESSYSMSVEEYPKIGKDGRNAYLTLIQDFNENQELLNMVSKWYEDNFENWKLDVLKIDAKTEIQYQVTISNKELSPINIVNVGQGIHQALPLVVRSYIHDEEPTLIIIEEPETHLHPAAHGNLAQRFVESFLNNKHKHYLVETHSLNFVLRLRKLVADGTISKDDLAIYYVDFDEERNESSMKLIEVDSDGEVEWWPEGIFNESLKEVIEIRKAQEKK